MASAFRRAWQHADVVLAADDLLLAAREHDPCPETLLVNAAAAELQWKVGNSIPFPRKSRNHINVDELRSTTQLLKEAALADPGTWQMRLQGSRVAAGALSKGRSAAPQLNCEFGLCLPRVLGGHLALGSAFIPSRWNPADDPTRNRPIRTPCVVGSSPARVAARAAAWGGAPSQARATAGWARLVLRLFESAGLNMCLLRLGPVRAPPSSPRAGEDVAGEPACW